MGQLMTEWLHDHKARCKALEALATLYRKNFL